MFVSRICATKGKTSPNLHAKKKVFSAQTVTVSAVRPSVGTQLTELSHLRSPLQLVNAAASLYHRLRPVPSGTRAACRRRCAAPPPAYANAATAAAAAATLFPLSPAAHTSAVPTAARGPYPGYLAHGTTYVATAAAPVAALTPQPSRHQPLPPDTLPGTSTPHCQPSTPPSEGDSAPFFLFTLISLRVQGLSNLLNENNLI
jgi:hypothetical protein